MDRYYTSMYWCVDEWLESQPNCSGVVADSVMEGLRRYAVPFSSIFPCNVTATTPPPPGSSASLDR